MKRLQTLAHGLLGIVGTCDDLRAAAITNAVVRRRVVLEMVNRPALHTRPSLRDAADDGVVGNEQLKNAEAAMPIPCIRSDDIVELLGLDDGAREPVEDEPLLRFACVPFPLPGGPMKMIFKFRYPPYPRRPRMRPFFMKPS